MRLNEFHRLNNERQHEAFAPAHSPLGLVACMVEELGELAGCILGLTGEKKRKAHKTKEEALDGVADLITYASLKAWGLGCTDLESLLADAFNMVSERAGSRVVILPESFGGEATLEELIADRDHWRARAERLEEEAAEGPRHG